MFSILLAILGEWLINWRLQVLYTGYDPYRLSLSYLSRSDSPVLEYVRIWGIAYTLFILIFALSLYQFFQPGGRLVRLVTLCWIIYALGEGIGSAFFAFDHLHGKLTLSAQIHNVVSGVGDACFFFLPIMMGQMIHPKQWASARQLAKITTLTGLGLMTLFLLSKWVRPDTGLLAYAGLWQRLFFLVYYIFFIVFAVKMTHLPGQKIN